nr:MAG TPA: hypothetical protein [Caudoviricetes sp.]
MFHFFLLSSFVLDYVIIIPHIALIVNTFFLFFIDYVGF